MKKIISLAIASLATLSIGAQNLMTGYFNEGYLNRHDINPAFDNEKNYVAMPLLGNINIGMRGNIGIDDVFFNRGGKTVTFMHPDVSISDALGNIEDKNKLTQSLRYQLLGFGFKSFEGYSTIELNLRENLDVNLPGDLFRMFKEPLTNKTYNLGDLDAHADAYAELALGHSHQLDEHWKIGAKVKLLLGLGAVDIKSNKAEVTLGKDSYVANLDAEIQANIKDLTYKYKEGTEKQVSGVESAKANLQGFGLAVDLGAEYRINDNWAVSLAITDLGFMQWSSNHLAKTSGEEFTTDGYVFNLDDKKFKKENAFVKLGEDLEDLYQLQDKGDQGSQNKGLASTVAAGVEYKAPFYDKLKFGLNNQTRINGEFTWTDFQLSANVAPLDWLSATMSYGIGTFGSSFGWMVNVHPKGFGLFMGMDYTFGKLSKQGVPLSSNGTFAIGINFPFGN